MTRILIADDHDVVRQGLRRLIESTPDLKFVGEARNGREAVPMTGETTADIVVNGHQHA